MEFGTVVIVVAIVAVLAAAVSYRGTGRIYSGLGREGGLDMTREPAAPASGAEVQEEIRTAGRRAASPGWTWTPSWPRSLGPRLTPIPACARRSVSS